MPIRHSEVVDMIAAARAFVSVSEHGSFTVGAAAIAVPQSVVSRRIAALEAHLGHQLIDRRTHPLSLTEFGRAVLHPARSLVRSAEAFEHHAQRAATQTVILLLPDLGMGRHIAALKAAATRAGLNLELLVAAAADRIHRVRTDAATAALSAAPPDAATWSLPLGLAAGRELPKTIVLESLRPRRGQAPGEAPRVWLDPEDDVPHVRDKVVHLRDRLGLGAFQVVVGGDLAAAAGAALGNRDFLLCTPPQAGRLGLQWRPIRELHVRRGYTLLASDSAVESRLRTALGDEIRAYVGGEAE